MKEVITKDGSTTFFNEEFQEHYHSTSGAEEEALKKFAAPLEPYLQNKEHISILDVCFGIGYTSAAAIDMYAGKYKSITFYCLEIDKEIVSKIALINTTFKHYSVMHAFAQALAKGFTSYTQDCEGTIITLHMLWGDAAETIKHINNIDAVLFDPFSPKKHPALWTKEFLLDVQKAMNPHAGLTTYSCAKTFRDILRELNFEVINGPCVGRKAPSTIAVKR